MRMSALPPIAQYSRGTQARAPADVCQAKVDHHHHHLPLHPPPPHGRNPEKAVEARSSPGDTSRCMRYALPLHPRVARRHHSPFRLLARRHARRKHIV
ncbi:hypothetical protein MRB53_041299 [Persea americana]|nr:hypothetical protein MRB53_041299 [Persea americana]